MDAPQVEPVEPEVFRGEAARAGGDRQKVVEAWRDQRAIRAGAGFVAQVLICNGPGHEEARHDYRRGGWCMPVERVGEAVTHVQVQALCRVLGYDDGYVVGRSGARVV